MNKHITIIRHLENSFPGIGPTVAVDYLELVTIQSSHGRLYFTLGDINLLYDSCISTFLLQANNLRVMLLGMVDDPRVVLIKLADRLHNMRTMYSLSKALY